MLILLNYSNNPVLKNEEIAMVPCKYIIYNKENIPKIRSSKHFFIDGDCLHDPDFNLFL